MKRVENLKKVTLAVRAGLSPGNMDLRIDDPAYEFIFGIGPGGMSPFEYELVAKVEGQEVRFELTGENVTAFFEHHNPPFTHLLNDIDRIYFEITIQSIVPASHREVVSAMAGATAHGHGCDCGCGC